MLRANAAYLESVRWQMRYFATVLVPAPFESIPRTASDGDLIVGAGGQLVRGAGG